MRLAVIGYGGMGQKHARIAREHGHEIVAIYDPNKNISDDLRAESVTEALQKADAGIVAVPAGLRDRIARELLAAGKPLLVEKPLALRPGAAWWWWRSGVPVVLAENWTWSHWAEAPPGSSWVMVFKPLSLAAVQPWVSDYAVGGGAFTEGGVHALTWWLHEVYNETLDELEQGSPDRLLERLEGCFSGTPMCGCLTLMHLPTESTLTLAIDWTEEQAFPGGVLLGLDAGGALLPGQTSLHETVGFEREWDEFMTVAQTGRMNEATRRVLAAGILACEVLWRWVLRHRLGPYG